MTWKFGLMFLQIVFGTFGINGNVGYKTMSDYHTVLEIQMSETSVITLNTTVRLRWNVSSPAVVGAVVHLQTLVEAVTISTSPTFPADTSYTGTSAGLWIPLSPLVHRIDVYARASNAVNAVVTAVPYSERDPVPGACNMEFRMENDPNIHLGFSEHVTVTEFAPANVGMPRGMDPPPCDTSQGAHTRWQLTYEVYQHFLPEGDLSEGALFKGLKEMSSVQAVKQHGRKVASFAPSSKTQLYGNAYESLGVIIVVVVIDSALNTSSLYVPASTYSCNFTSMIPPTCPTPGQIFSRVLFSLLGAFGLLVCFAGHRFLEAEYFFFGFLVSSFLSVVLMGRFSGQNAQLCLLYATVAGWWGGVLCALCRWRFGIPVLLTSLAGLVLGTLLAATFLFTPIINEDLMRNDFLFWTCVAAIVFLLLVFMLPFTRILNMVACSVVGSYAAVVMVGECLPSSLPYIIIALLRRAVNPLYRQVILIAPFQTPDLILAVLWVLLAVCGVVSQHLLTRKRLPFPPCPYQRKIRALSPAQPNERTPLLPGGEEVVFD